MSSIFPIREKVSLDREPEPRLVDLDEETADEVFEALASQTTRKIFLELHRQPQTASDLAEVTETSVQNVQYHLEKLGNVDLVEVVDTWYSERGSEMKVYAPQDESLVLFAGRDKQGAFRRLVNRFAGVFALLVPPSILAGWLANQTGPGPEEVIRTQYAAADDDSADDDVDVSDADVTDDAVAEDTDDVAEPDDEEAGVQVAEDDAEDDASETPEAEETPEPEPEPTPEPEPEPTPEQTPAPEETPEPDMDVETTTSFENYTVEFEFADSQEAAEVVAAENETVFVMLESTGGSDIMGIDPAVAGAFLLGGLVVYGALAFRRRII